MHGAGTRAARSPARARADGRLGARSSRVAPEQYDPKPASAIRTLPRESGAGRGHGPGHRQPRPAVVRPISPDKAAKVHVVEPADFGDAKEIGDRFKAGQPVIVTLQGRPAELRRRLVDFCSGVVYVLDGSMKQVTRGVYLLTPSNVEVSAEEKRRLQEQGLFRS